MYLDELINKLTEIRKKVGGHTEVCFWDDDSLEELKVDAIYDVPANEEEFLSERVDICLTKNN